MSILELRMVLTLLHAEIIPMLDHLHIFVMRIIYKLLT